MTLNYSVETTEVRPLFTPSQLRLEVSQPYEKTSGMVLRITSILTEYTTYGTRVETETRELPATFLDAITGLDKTTFQPVVDTSALDSILLQFQLRLKP